MREAALECRFCKRGISLDCGTIRRPALDRLVAAGRRDPTVVREHQIAYPAAVRIPRLHSVAIVHFPELDRTVFAGGREDIGIAPPTHVAHGTIVPAEIQILA